MQLVEVPEQPAYVLGSGSWQGLGACTWLRHLAESHGKVLTQARGKGLSPGAWLRSVAHGAQQVVCVESHSGGLAHGNAYVSGHASGASVHGGSQLLCRPGVRGITKQCLWGTVLMGLSSTYGAQCSWNSRVFEARLPLSLYAGVHAHAAALSEPCCSLVAARSSGHGQNTGSSQYWRAGSGCGSRCCKVSACTPGGILSICRIAACTPGGEHESVDVLAQDQALLCCMAVHMLMRRITRAQDRAFLCTAHLAARALLLSWHTGLVTHEVGSTTGECGHTQVAGAMHIKVEK
eukprot:1158454-Pelagomonas_calceolata.AAC.8